MFTQDDAFLNEECNQIALSIFANSLAGTTSMFGASGSRFLLGQ